MAELDPDLWAQKSPDPVDLDLDPTPDPKHCFAELFMTNPLQIFPEIFVLINRKRASTSREPIIKFLLSTFPSWMSLLRASILAIISSVEIDSLVGSDLLTPSGIVTRWLFQSPSIIYSLSRFMMSLMSLMGL